MFYNLHTKRMNAVHQTDVRPAYALQYAKMLIIKHLPPPPDKFCNSLIVSALRFYCKKVIFFLLFSAVSFNGFSQIPTNGLKGYWQLDGNVNDASGNNNHGSLQGGTVYCADRFGVPNKAVKLGGFYNSSAIHIPNSASLNLTNALTIACWFKLDDRGGMDGWGNYSTITCNHTFIAKDGDRSGFWLFYNIYQNTQNPHFSIYNNTSCSTTPTFTYSDAQSCVNTEWIHFAIVVDSISITMYINGMQKHRQTYNPQITFTKANSNDLTFGRFGYNCGLQNWYPLNGKLDDIVYYNRALSQAEITQLYNYPAVYASPTAMHTDTIRDNVNLGEVYERNGFSLPVQTQSGVQTYSRTNGCDSVWILKLNVIDSKCDSTKFTDIHTACGSFVWIDGKTYYASNNTARHIIPNAAGCDSIITLNLTVKPAETVIFKDTTCINRNYNRYNFNILANKLQTAGNFEFRDTMLNTSGCDSIIILKLTVKPLAVFTIKDTVCQNIAYVKHGFNISASELQTAGKFEFCDTVSNSAGCDSVIVLNISVIAKDTVFIFDTVCEGKTYVKNGFNVSDAGVYTQNLFNRFHCDSTVILNLAVVQPPDTVFIFDSICAGQTYQKYDFNVSKSDVYVKNLHTRLGCDSTVVLNLTVNQNPDIQISVIADKFCDKDFIELKIITNGTSFHWNTGSTENPITFYEAGFYLVTAFLGDCQDTASYTVEECPCLVFIPNAFTPNGDGINDVFNPSISCAETLKFYRLNIYDRWGNLIFWSFDYAAGWDGTFYNGGTCAEGVYSCTIEYTTSKNEHVVKYTSIYLFR